MRPIQKSVISIFIIFQFLTMLRVHLPIKSKYFETLFTPIDVYLSFFSVYQDWMMFAPNPSKTNVLMSAKVLFDDGSVDIYHFPDASKMGLFSKYTGGEKYRKIISEGIRKDSNSFMWRDVAKFALRKISDRNYGKMPLKVFLNRHWSQVPDMANEFRPHDKNVSDYQTYTFYTYEVI